MLLFDLLIRMFLLLAMDLIAAGTLSYRREGTGQGHDHYVTVVVLVLVTLFDANFLYINMVYA